MDFIIVFGVLGAAIIGIAVLCVVVPVIGIFILAGLAVLGAAISKPIEYLLERLQ